tara:strand:- start:112 stop:288 length:177 start_codon:yes stop_codon:yes gene_type:complete
MGWSPAPGSVTVTVTVMGAAISFVVPALQTLNAGGNNADIQKIARARTVSSAPWPVAS